MAWRVAVTGTRKSGPQAGNAIFSYIAVADNKTFRSWTSASDYALKKGLEDPPYYDKFFFADGTPKKQACRVLLFFSTGRAHSYPIRVRSSFQNLLMSPDRFQTYRMIRL
ncbi:PFP-BETA1 [Symbiodinium sp. CCMP2592]|nr:PFP-BETA1 [Symbiodinium sp. CCMP2592]